MNPILFPSVTGFKQLGTCVPFIVAVTFADIQPTALNALFLSERSDDLHRYYYCSKLHTLASPEIQEYRWTFILIRESIYNCSCLRWNSWEWSHLDNSTLNRNVIGLRNSCRKFHFLLFPRLDAHVKCFQYMPWIWVLMIIVVFVSWSLVFRNRRLTDVSFPARMSRPNIISANKKRGICVKLCVSFLFCARKWPCNWGTENGEEGS